MFTVELINPGAPDADIVVTGTLVEGEKLNGLCCPGHDWEVSHVFRHHDTDPVTEHTYYGGCHNPECSIAPDSHWHGVSSHDGFSIAKWMLDHDSFIDDKTASVINITCSDCKQPSPDDLFYFTNAPWGERQFCGSCVEKYM